MTHPNPDPYQRDSITSDTSPCPTCHSGAALPVGQVCQTCGRDYRDFGAPADRVPAIFNGLGLVMPAGATGANPYEPLVFDGPATVVPDQIKKAAGLQPDDQLSLIDLSGVLLIVVITDDEQAHLGGPATTPEKIHLLQQVLDGLEALQ